MVVSFGSQPAAFFSSSEQLFVNPNYILAILRLARDNYLYADGADLPLQRLFCLAKYIGDIPGKVAFSDFAKRKIPPL